MTSTEIETEIKEAPRDTARRLIGQTLGKKAIGYQFRILETRLRQPYAAALSEDDRNRIRNYLSNKLEEIEQLLAGSDEAEAFNWSEDGANDE